jgi:heme oxygenase
MAVLREKTQAPHHALEAALDWNGAFSSPARYAELLRRFHAAVLGADLVIDQWIDSTPYVEARRTAAWIAADLQQLSEQHGVEPQPLSRPADYQFVESRAAAIGALYVLEGSALGGQILSAQLRTRLGITPETGGRYLQAYGERTGEIWKAFREWVNSELTSSTLLTEEAVPAALATFERFTACLTGRVDG